MLRGLPSRRLTFPVIVLVLLSFLYLIGRPTNSSPFSRLDRAKQGPPYRKPARQNVYELVVENFPAAAAARTTADLPPLPRWMRPQEDAYMSMPLLIGFTRNWPMLQQAVVSYIAAGWPPSLIHVAENTGTMDANELGQLSLQNQFYLNYTRLKDLYGVNVISTPTLLTFSQLQNFYLHTAMRNKWPYYFWAHMDNVAVTDEKVNPFESFFTRISKVFADATSSEKPTWGAYFFGYDHLTLVNTAAYREVGGFDPMISFYLSDCDFYERLKMAGYTIEEANVGHLIDVGTSLPDLALLFHPNYQCPGGVDSSNLHFGLNDCRHQFLIDTLNKMSRDKLDSKDGRNFWQSTQRGGQGEPFYTDPRGFEWTIRTTKKHGTDVYIQKWGNWRCDLVASGYKPEDAWNVQQEIHYEGWNWVVNQDREDPLDTIEM